MPLFRDVKTIFLHRYYQQSHSILSIKCEASSQNQVEKNSRLQFYASRWNFQTFLLEATMKLRRALILSTVMIRTNFRVTTIHFCNDHYFGNQNSTLPSVSPHGSSIFIFFIHGCWSNQADNTVIVQCTCTVHTWRFCTSLTTSCMQCLVADDIFGQSDIHARNPSSGRSWPLTN